MKVLRLFSASMRLASTIDRARFASDPDYPQFLIAELCGEQNFGRNIAPAALTKPVAAARYAA